MVSLSYHVRLVLLSAFIGAGHAANTVRSLNSTAPSVDLGYVKYMGYNNATSGINYFRGIP